MIDQPPLASETAIQDDNQPSGRGTPDIEDLGLGALGPAAATKWADLIIRYWRLAQSRGQVRLDQPFELLDLSLPRASAVRLLLRSLQERIGQLGPGARLRYLLCTPSGKLPGGWKNTAELKPYLQDGSLAALSWDLQYGVAERPTANLMGERPSTNPCAIVARDVWRQLDQQLFAVHHGRLFEARFQSPAGANIESDPEVAWSPVRQAPGGQAAEAAMEGYVKRLNSAPVVLSIGAMRVIGQFETLLPQGYLMLATDRGHASEKAMRLCNLDKLVERFRHDPTLPVNFHLLNEFVEQTGAAVWQRTGSRDRVLQVALAGGDDPGSMLDEVIAPLELGAGGDSEDLAHVMKTIVLHGRGEDVLGILRHADHDPLVFMAAGAGLLGHLAQPDCDRSAWVEALSRVWDHHLAAPGEFELHRHIAAAATALGSWSLARRVLQDGLRAHGEQAGDLSMLANCEANTGRLESALDLAERSDRAKGGEARTLDLIHRLRNRIDRMDRLWRRSLPVPGTPLVLEPLDVDHAEAFFRQYRDPQIAAMTRLPRFSSIEDLQRWIRKVSLASNRMRFVVMHEDSGLVGYVSLRPSGSAAHFGFWTGVDFQGQGHAVQAGLALCQFALRNGFDWLFAAVFDHNLRSLRALQRIGFMPLNYRSAAEEDRRSFFYFGESHAADVDEQHDIESARQAFLDCMYVDEDDLRLVDEHGKPVLPRQKPRD
ncbi:conserved hypothetical protein [Burkholderiales bacterium 8X]|nr:conserved hypothetical protein [Burkholderiales bacterium 8X]